MWYEKRMRKKIVILGALVVLVCVAIAITLYIRNRDGNGVLTLYGNVDVRQVNIGFRVPGQVKQLFFEEGDCVKKGSLMAVLDLTPYNSQVQEAEARVKAAKVDLSNAELLLKRREALIGVGGVSEENLEDRQTNYDRLVANLLSAEAALAVSRDQLSYTHAYAPNDGVVLTRIREPGTTLNPTDPVYTLSLSTPIWVRAYVSEPDLGKVQYGMQAKVTTDTPGAPSYIGRVGFISPVAEFTPKTVQTTELRTDLVYRLRIYIDQPDALLKQGMPVTVELSTEKSGDGYGCE